LSKVFQVTVLGAAGAAPTKYRHPSSHFIRIDGTYLLLDCGEGTQRQLSVFGLRAHNISYIFITHLHGDHYFGLPGLISSFALVGRTKPLFIIGPADLENIVHLFLAENVSVLPYELKFIRTQTDRIDTVVSTEQFEVVSVPLKHRVPCTGFIVKELGPQLILDIDTCVKYKVPFEFYESIKFGSDYRSNSEGIISNHVLTKLGNTNRSYAYITDTIYDPDNLIQILKNVNLLYHEATFLDELSYRATETFHTTALQAAQIAKAAKVKKLMIGHFSSRYNNVDRLISEARTIFLNTIEAVEGVTIDIL
jgi:ribonuclease Z